MTNLPNTGNGYNYYILGMTSANAEPKVRVTDPNSNVWNQTLSSESQG